jgi:hypothetical protein
VHASDDTLNHRWRRYETAEAVASVDTGIFTDGAIGKSGGCRRTIDPSALPRCVSIDDAINEGGGSTETLDPTTIAGRKISTDYAIRKSRRGIKTVYPTSFTVS